MTIYSLNVKKKKQPKSGEALKHTKKVSIAANLKKKKKKTLVLFLKNVGI